MKMIAALFTALGLIAAASSLSLAAQTAAHDDFGVLVMAHGGGAEWNAEVEKMLAPLKNEYRLELAFGMADPATMEAAIHRLEARGVRRIAVVRLFISGDSFLDRTQQVLGLAPGAPPKPAAAAQADHGAHGGHSMALWRIATSASFALSREGLADVPEMGAVLAERARTLSRDPKVESVLILAHGPGDDAENARWISQIDARAAAVRSALPFTRVHVETLREDWPDKRVAAEARIRDFIEAAGKNGGRAIVIPYRVAGFGPYAKVLEGLTYASDGKGLLPSTAAEHWVRRQIEELRKGGFRTPTPVAGGS
jgi:sirohydrochlorin cobaltochelatase